MWYMLGFGICVVIFVILAANGVIPAK